MHPNHNQQSQPDKYGFKDEGNQTLGHSTKTKDHEQALSASQDQTTAHRGRGAAERTSHKGNAGQGLHKRGAASAKAARVWWLLVVVAKAEGGKDVYGAAGGCCEGCVGRLGFRVRFAMIPNRNKEKA